MTNGGASELGQMDRVQGLLHVLGDVAGARIVDIGCGEGEIARGLAQAGATVQGYDPFIAGTDETPFGAGGYRLTNARADALPEPDGTADIALFVFSLHHVPHAAMPAALAEARRVLKPGGRLCVAEPLAEGAVHYIMEPYHDETEVRSNATLALAAHAAPAFARESIFHFSEPRIFADFDAYAARAKAGMRFNGYTEAQVMNPEVARRFAEMAAVHGAHFEQRVRVNLFQ